MLVNNSYVEPGAARPNTPAGAKAFTVSPFARLARTHVASAMADAMVAASLAGSLFFTLPAGDARTPVLRYLVITMLPFAVVSPLIGPLIDRMKGGHRLMVIASAIARAAASYLMATEVKSESLVFFFYALCLLVFQKAYQVGRSALVPTVVESATELVEANSKLALLSGLSGFVGVIPAGLLLLAGPEWALGLAMIVYIVAAVMATRIQPVRVAAESADATERIELRGATIVMAGSAMGLIRAAVGFLTLLVAFDFRGGDRQPWEFAVVGGASVLSQLGGAAAGPRIRQLTSEENLLTGVLALVAGAGFLSLLLGDVTGATILGASVGFAAGGGKLAFDSILQRDAPDANRGRAFAKFETRFQIMWVIGALVPVAVEMNARAGFALVFLLAVIALGTYVLARMAYAHRTGSRQTAAYAAAAGIEDRFAEVSGGVKGRIASAPKAAYRRMRAGKEIGDDEYYDDEYYEAESDEAEYQDEYDGEYEAEYEEEGIADQDEPVATVVLDDPTTGQTATVAVDEPEYGDEAFGDNPDEWAQPVWADEVPDSAWAPTGDPSGRSGVAWDPDVETDLENPFPWSPDEPTRRQP